MTKTVETLAISWLHCNDCHRAFENHNRLESSADGRLQVVKSDLGFSMTSCGHFFCDNCVDNATENGKFVCKVCKELANRYRVEGRIPKNLEMYITPPVSMLEDALSVMTFQLNNANQLIKSLRAKVSQQKELITKAKQELVGHKSMKENVAKIEAENEQLKFKIANFISDSQDAISVSKKAKTEPIPSPQVPSIKVNGRLSLKSPIIGTPPMSSRRAKDPFVQIDCSGNTPFPFNPAPSFHGSQETPNLSVPDSWNHQFKHAGPNSFNHPNQQYQKTPNRYTSNYYGHSAPSAYPFYNPAFSHFDPSNPPMPPSCTGSPRPFFRRSSNQPEHGNNYGY